MTNFPKYLHDVSIATTLKYENYMRVFYAFTDAYEYISIIDFAVF